MSMPQAEVFPEVLSDKSTVYGVRLDTGNGSVIKFDCIDQATAHTLMRALNDGVADVEIDL